MQNWRVLRLAFDEECADCGLWVTLIKEQRGKVSVSYCSQPDKMVNRTFCLPWAGFSKEDSENLNGNKVSITQRFRLFPTKNL